MAIVTGITAFNVLTRRHDFPAEPWLRPVVLEVSSAVSTAVVFAIPAAVAVWLRRRPRPWWRAAPTHILAGVAYSAVHVAGFVALRSVLVPATLHGPYRFGPLTSQVPYELAKDVVSYALATSAFWLMLGWRRPTVTAQPEARPKFFDIQDGSRLVRTPLSDILAIRAAGNYAEFILKSGNRPLMRTSLAALHQELGPAGFVRTHRSWVVNGACVTGLRPEGFGDYTIVLGAIEAPLSRRSPAALEALRSGGTLSPETSPSLSTEAPNSAIFGQ